MMKEAITWQKQKHYNILIDKQTVWVKTDGILRILVEIRIQKKFSVCCGSSS
jgi:hypothetical protein